MLIEKEDGTLIYQGLIIRTARLIPNLETKAAIERRENILRILLGLLMGGAVLERNGHISGIFPALIIALGLISVCELNFFIRNLPKTNIRASSNEIDKETINATPSIYAYFLFLMGCSGLILSVLIAIKGNDLPLTILAIYLGLMSIAIIYAGLKLIKGKQSNNSFKG